uniref:Protein kinase domain-containing protein n=1 Tax=Nelumbo nucifera TaxID=4432 RepID=A0A822YH04_NELNU|nr:TPA_asm: hypothetical protein HUJ06_010573 [Nelumbo nucifera]
MSPLPVCSFTGSPPTAASAQTVVPSDGEGRIPKGTQHQCHTGEKKIYANNGGGGGGDGNGTTATDRSKLVFFDRRKQFELEDLLRASAKMLGKGSLGTVYKAILEDGCTVTVKRLKDANPCARKEFEHYIDLIGNLQHPNVVHLRAYYYTKEENLLVYDYLSHVSFHSFSMEYSGSKIPHGNVKSSNVLLNKNGVACISEFGLALLLSPVHATTRLGGYRAPEQIETKKLSQKADIYSFEVLLLEVLIGRLRYSILPQEWTELLRYKNMEEEMVAMLNVGLTCVVEQGEKRPTMSEVA